MLTITSGWSLIVDALLGSLFDFERHSRRSFRCLLASLFTACTSTSHLAHSAASSVQQIRSKCGVTPC
ncbi:hypothetical protein ACFX13_023359 [Malus domestica]